MNKFAAALAALSISGLAHAVDYNLVLTFDGATACGASACANYDQVSQSYGDDLNGNFSYFNVNTPGESLKYWAADYNDLTDVAWTAGGDGSSRGRIEVEITDAEAITLNGFDFGAFNRTTRSTHIRVYQIDSDGDFLPAWGYDGDVGSGSTLSLIHI